MNGNKVKAYAHQVLWLCKVELALTIKPQRFLNSLGRKIKKSITRLCSIIFLKIKLPFLKGKVERDNSKFNGINQRAEMVRFPFNLTMRKSNSRVGQLFWCRMTSQFKGPAQTQCPSAYESSYFALFFV